MIEGKTRIMIFYLLINKEFSFDYYEFYVNFNGFAYFFRQVNMVQFHKMLQHVLDRLNEDKHVSV